MDDFEGVRCSTCKQMLTWEIDPKTGERSLVGHAPGCPDGSDSGDSYEDEVNHEG